MTRTSLIAVFFAFSLSFCILSFAENAPAAGVAKVTQVDGEVFVVSPKGEKQKLKLGDSVSQHAVIVTSESSTVGLLFADQSEVKVGAKTQFEINVSDQVATQVELKLKEGVLKSLVKKRADSERFFRIRTHAATMGVRGTEFVTTVTMDAERQTHEQVMVLEGSVQVSDLSGKPLGLVKGGMGMGFASMDTPKGPMLNGPVFQPAPLSKAQRESIHNEKFLRDPKMLPPQPQSPPPAPHSQIPGAQNRGAQAPGDRPGMGSGPGSGPGAGPGNAPNAAKFSPQLQPPPQGGAATAPPMGGSIKGMAPGMGPGPSVQSPGTPGGALNGGGGGMMPLPPKPAQPGLPAPGGAVAPH